jgi:hypothetical protein
MADAEVDQLREGVKLEIVETLWSGTAHTWPLQGDDAA